MGGSGVYEEQAPSLTGVPFNDAYRYMDWLLTVPLLLIEILLVMKLEPKQFSCKAKALGIGSALMIASGYYGELVVTGNLAPRWICWFISMYFFYNIVHELLIGLSEATNAEASSDVADKIKTAQRWTVVSWYLPGRLPLPHVGHRRPDGRGSDPDRILRLGHHLKVRRWPCYLPDLCCEDEDRAGVGLGREQDGRLGFQPFHLPCTVFYDQAAMYRRMPCALPRK